VTVEPLTTPPEAFRCLALACLAVLLLACACGEPEEIRPSQYYIFSFEGSMEGWNANGVDLENPAVAWYVQRAVDMSRDSVSSAQFYLENLNERAKIWMERVFNVDSSADYHVTVRYSLASRDWAGTSLWTILTGVSPRAVSVPEELGYQDDTGTGTPSDVGHRWLYKTYEFEVHSSSTGKLYVHIGVHGKSKATRTYYVDLISVAFAKT
jgi:hypothetical protein